MSDKVAYNREYRRLHPEKVKAWHKASYARNRERKLARNAEWRARNRDHLKIRTRAYQRDHPESQRRAHLKANYGITLERYNEILVAQGHMCAICRSGLQAGRKTHVDHDHKTSEVRGILCGHCNVGIAMFREDRGRLAAAIEYLQRTAK